MTDSTSVLCALEHERLRTYLCDQFTADGYHVEQARTGRELEVKGRNQPPTVLLLGRLERRHDELRQLRSIRTGQALRSDIDPAVGIIVLGSDPGQLAMLRAFAAGCDDYVACPPRYGELRARLDALARRMRLRVGGAKRVGALAVDPNRRLASYAGEPLVLSATEFALLDYLAADPDRVATKQELLRTVWGYRATGRSRTVDAHACRLRKRLRAAGARGMVVNVRGVGYRLTALPSLRTLDRPLTPIMALAEKSAERRQRAA
jgi:DNA-binding response OmpR family regulator